MEDAKITTPELGIKVKYEHEVYRLLSTDWNVYISPFKEMKSDFLWLIVRGEKRVSLELLNIML